MKPTVKLLEDESPEMDRHMLGAEALTCPFCSLAVYINDRTKRILHDEPAGAAGVECESFGFAMRQHDSFAAAASWLRTRRPS